MYKIPKRFYDDCQQYCDIPIPEILKETKNHYWISKNEDAKLHELRDRALCYAEPCPDYWEYCRGIVLSARATLNVIGWEEVPHDTH